MWAVGQDLASGYDSPEETLRGCLNPPEKWQGVAGAPPAIFRPLYYFAHVGRWARGDPANFWSPGAPCLACCFDGLRIGIGLTL